MPDETLQIGSLIHKLREVEKQTVRSIERLNKKLINNRYAVIFNEFCIKENLLPRYTDFKLYDRAVRHKRITLSYRKQLLLDETEEKVKASKSLEEQIVKVKCLQKTC